MNKLTLKEIQQAELDIMIEFDKVARENGLKYALWAGTLIGAVRHHGFIPWDDDIDVTMPRPDYEKLIRLNKEKKLWPDHLELCCFEDGTLDTPFLKIYDRRTTVIEQNYNKGKTQSLWIDVFPVDGLPEDEKEIQKFYRKGLFLSKLNVLVAANNGFGKGRLKTLVKDIFLKPIAKLIGRRRIAEMQYKHGTKYPYETSPKCGMCTWAYDGPGQALTKEEYETLVELPFEGHYFYAMSAWDKNLRGIFGDYMQLPPESERITHDLEAYRE